jgi:hypothetical protein
MLLLRTISNIKILKHHLILILVFLILVFIWNVINGFSINTYQVFIEPLICWIVIIFYNNHISCFGDSLMKTNPKVLKILMTDFFIINFMFIVISIFSILFFVEWGKALISLLLHYSSQILFLSTLTLLTCIIFQNFEAPLIVMLSYYSAALLGVLEKLNIHSVFYFSGNYFSLHEALPMILTNLSYTIIFIVFDWMILDEKTRKN